jgi:hypothetical protein
MTQIWKHLDEWFGRYGGFSEGEQKTSFILWAGPGRAGNFFEMVIKGGAGPATTGPYTHHTTFYSTYFRASYTICSPSRGMF